VATGVNADGRREILGLEVTSAEAVFDQIDAVSVRARHAWVVQTLEAKHPAAAEHLDAAREDLLAFAAFPPRDLAAEEPQGEPASADSPP
jgi:transposase-like protein